MAKAGRQTGAIYHHFHGVATLAAFWMMAKDS